MTTNGVVGRAAKQHERTSCECHIRGGVVGLNNRESKPQQTGHDRLHHPFSKTGTDEAGSEAE